MIDKIKSFFNIKDGGDNKKKVENLAVLALILIITIIAINMIWKNDNEKEKHADDQKVLAQEEDTNKSCTQTIDGELERILSQIEGVGKVKAYVTYYQTSQIIPVYNEDISQKDTNESDKQGGTRKIIETDTKKEIVYEEMGGQKKIITKSIISPQIEGAIITAEGGGNNKIKADIIAAVSAVTGLSTHKIQVYKMKGER